MCSVLTATGLWSIGRLTDQSAERAERYGTSLAASLAALAADPLLRQDRLHLSVIANRMLDSADVVGITIFSADQQMLALGGNPQGGVHYTQPINLNDAAVGYARVSLDPQAFSNDSVAAPLARLLVVVAAPALVVLLLGLAAGEAGALPARLRTRLARAAPAAAEVEEPPEPVELTHYLLAVNLYNQLTLDPGQRDQELDHAAALAERVADIYGGAVARLPGTGLLVTFTDTGDTDIDEDQPFQVICAGLVLGQLLKAAETRGEYRLGMHVLKLPSTEDVSTSADAVADAGLLSALARHQSLTVSASLFARLHHPERLKAVPLRNALLEELSTDSGCQLVSGVAPGHESQLSSQIEKLRF